MSVVEVKNVELLEGDDDDLETAEAVPLKISTDETDDKRKTTRRVFEVVAPADLPKGYRLTVVSNNEEVVIIVPEGGVKKMQTFQGREALPVTKHWADSEFDFAPNYEGNFCFLAFFFPALAWSFIMRKLGMDPCGRQPVLETEQSRKLANLVPWVVGLVLFFSGSLQPFAGAYLLYLVTVGRGAVRKKYNIPGSCLGDLLCTAFCGCCTALQSFRHMKRNGDTPCEACGDSKAHATQV